MSLIIRAVNPSDSRSLARLTPIGTRHYTHRRGLVAEVDGMPVAAISLSSGAVVADLDRADLRLVRSLKYRRYQILRQSGGAGDVRTELRRHRKAA
jgi:hypothetical protein